MNTARVAQSHSFVIRINISHLQSHLSPQHDDLSSVSVHRHETCRLIHSTPSELQKQVLIKQSKVYNGNLKQNVRVHFVLVIKVYRNVQNKSICSQSIKDRKSSYFSSIICQNDDTQLTNKTQIYIISSSDEFTSEKKYKFNKYKRIFVRM